MKKIVSFLLALVLTLSLTSTALAAVVSPKTDVAEVMAGEAVKLTVNASEEEPLTGIVCLNYRVYFDPALFELDAQASAAGMDGVKLTALKTDEDGKSYYAVSLLDPTSEGLGVKGDLYSLVFKLKDDAAAGAEGTFTITKAHVYTIADGAMQTVENGAVENGTLTVKVAAQPVPEVVFGHSAASGKPMLTWNAVSGATSYKVYRATSQKGTYSLLGTVTATSYTNTGAKAGVTYYYKVKAVNSAGESAYSNVVSGRATVTTLTMGHSASSGKPQLTWKAVSGAASYRVYRATAKNGAYSVINTTKALTYTNVGAALGTTYYYKVEALNASGKSMGFSAIVEGKVAPVLAVGYSGVSGKPQLTWKAVPGATEYQVYRSTQQNSGYAKINTTTSTSYVNTGAKAGTTYYYRIVAVKGTAVSDFSNIVNARPGK